jgi:hypothetical protein
MLCYRGSSPQNGPDMEALLRSLRHDGERGKAAALLDQQERYQAELAVAAGRERSVREERDFLMRQQQQQLDLIAVKLHYYDPARLEHLLHHRDILCCTLCYPMSFLHVP